MFSLVVFIILENLLIIDNNRETLELLFKNKDDIKIRKFKTTLGFAQGRISDISGVPGGVLFN